MLLILLKQLATSDACWRFKTPMKSSILWLLERDSDSVAVVSTSACAPAYRPSTTPSSQETARVRNGPSTLVFKQILFDESFWSRQFPWNSVVFFISQTNSSFDATATMESRVDRMLCYDTNISRGMGGGERSLKGEI